MITFSEYLHSLKESKDLEDFEEVIEGYAEKLESLKAGDLGIQVSKPSYGHEYPSNYAVIEVKSCFSFDHDAIEKSRYANMLLALVLQDFECPASNIALRPENGFSDSGEFQLTYDTRLTYRTRLSCDGVFVIRLKISCTEASRVVW